MPEFPRLFPERDESEVQARANERPMTDVVKLADEKSNLSWKNFGRRCSLVPTLNTSLAHCSGDTAKAVLQLGSLL